MIVTAAKAKMYIKTNLTDEVLEEKLQALEQLVRKYTNNNFQQRNIRTQCNIVSQKLFLVSPIFKVGDTVQLSETRFNDGVYTVKEIAKSMTTLNEALIDEPHALATLVKYPLDVQQGVINLLKWDIENRDKVGIASETISRHSVTYFDMTDKNVVMGYPVSLMGFLKPYMKARF